MHRSNCGYRMVLSLSMVLVLQLALTASATRADAPGVASSLPARRSMQSAAWVKEGARVPKHLLYMITDANCPYCHDLWAALRPLYKQGLQVRYVMVGILQENSTGKAAAILEAKDPAAALDLNESMWAQLPDDLGGGISPLSSPDDKTLSAIGRNERLMHDLGVQGTPALVYYDVDGKITIVQSVPTPARLKTIVSHAAPD